MINARGLTVDRAGVRVLHGLTFQIGRGAICGLLGPSGSGKSTLMRALVGVQLNVSGELQIMGMTAGAPPLRSTVAYLTQNPALYGELTALENLLYFGRILDVGSLECRAALERVALGSLADRPVNTLSGGQRARVALASVLLASPKVLVLDEPTVGLDPLLRQRLWQLFDELAAEGATLLISSHVMDEARHCADLLLLRDGRLIARGSPEGLLRDTRAVDLDEAFLRLVQRNLR